MDFKFTEQQLLLRNSVHEFLQKECPKNYIRELEDRREYPEEIFRKIADKGWLGVNIPEEYGGSGGDLMDFVIIGEELSKCWISLALDFGTNACFGGRTLYCHGTEEQKSALLPEMCKGEARFAGAFTEPGGGTDLLAMTTNAVKQDGNWIVNGQKTFITAAQEADYLITIVRTEKNPVKRASAFTIFLINAKSKGIEINKLHKLGAWSSDTNEIFDSDVKVPDSARIGEVNQGFYLLTDTLNNERIMVATMSLGNGEAAFEDALEYAKQRQAFGRPIGQFQMIQRYLAELKIEIDAAKLLIYRAASLEAEGLPCYLEATMADYFASEVALKCTTTGMRILAGASVTMENAMQRYFRDGIMTVFGPISNEMCLNQIAQYSLKLPRSY